MNWIDKTDDFIWGWVWEIKGFFEMLWSDWIGRFLALMILVIGTIVSVLILIGFCHAADSWFLSERYSSAVITSHNHHDSYWAIMPAGKVLVPMQMPERWSVEVKVAGQFEWISVKHSFWANTEDGETCRVGFRQGRFSQSVYLDEIYYK